MCATTACYVQNRGKLDSDGQFGIFHLQRFRYFKKMNQICKPLETIVSGFHLNPNFPQRIVTGFAKCLEKPIEINDPAPEFALTVPADLGGEMEKMLTPTSVDFK